MSVDPRDLLALVPDADLIAELRRRGVDLSKLNGRACAWCERVFTPDRAQRYCSVECRGHADAERRADPRAAAARREREGAWRAKNRTAYNAYQRWYQREWRRRRTEAEAERLRGQKREWARQDAAERRGRVA